jgi:hypothetical protein
MKQEDETANPVDMLLPFLYHSARMCLVDSNSLEDDDDFQSGEFCWNGLFRR